MASGNLRHDRFRRDERTAARHVLALDDSFAKDPCGETGVLDRRVRDTPRRARSVGGAPDPVSAMIFKHQSLEARPTRTSGTAS